MTGQELIKLKDSRAFRQSTMDSIINEFEPADDQFLLTDSFLPFKLVDKDVLIDLINHGAFGRTNPVNLGSDHKRVSIPGFGYKEHTAGHWREAIKFDEEVLLKAVDPSRPTERWGEGLAAASLNFLDLRLNNLIEYVTAQVVVNGTYSEARYGVNYTYNPKIPAKYFQNVTSSPSWTSAGTWATAANAKPIADIIGAKNEMARFGHNVDAVYMNINTLEKFYGAADTQTMVKASPAIVGRSADRTFVFETLTGVKLIIDNRLYAEETKFTAASAASDTTLDVENAGEFTAGDRITLRNSANEEEERIIDSISSNTITITAGTTYAYAEGDRVTVYKRFTPDNKVIMHSMGNVRSGANNWLSTPSLVKGQSWTRPQPGRYTWKDFNTTVPYTLEIGAGIDGGPKIGAANWMCISVTA